MQVCHFLIYVAYVVFMMKNEKIEKWVLLKTNATPPEAEDGKENLPLKKPSLNKNWASLAKAQKWTNPNSVMAFRKAMMEYKKKDAENWNECPIPKDTDSTSDKIWKVVAFPFPIVTLSFLTLI